MDVSSIASASISMSLSRVQQDAGISIMKKTMDIEQSSYAGLIQSMDTASSNCGKLMDVRA